MRNRNPKFGRFNRPNLFYPIYVNPQESDKDSFCPISLTADEDFSVEVLPLNSAGGESCWRWGKDLVSKNIGIDTLHSNVVAYRKTTGEYGIYEKYRKTTYKAKSIWVEDDVITERGTIELGKLGLASEFAFPKPIYLIHKAIILGNGVSDMILDYFAGSGTTGHAVINLNREDSEQRRYILVEQAGYFDTVLRPRLQKVVYAAEWKDGTPVAGSPGVSHAFEYMALESYEDTLDNLDLDLAAAPQPGLFPPQRDDYLLRYFLDHETRQARLTLSIFDHPFEATIRVRRDCIEQRAQLDLVETANFLLGMIVTERSAFTHQERTYRLVQGQIGRRSVAVIWRNTPGLDLVTEAAYIQSEIFPHRLPDRLYINGDSHIPNAMPIQQVFTRAMLDVPQGYKAD